MEIFYIFAGLTLLGLIAYGLQIWAVRSTLKSKHHKKTIEESAYSLVPTAYHPPISILKPLKGLDDNLFDNLESFCTQDYPKYEIIFALQNHNDPAYKVAKKIKDKYPDRDISIIVERCDDGLNPKVNNLIPAYKASKYPYILVSDSNVMVDNKYMRETIKHMEDPEVGLVSNIVKGVRGNTIGSIFENLHMNTFILGGVCSLNKFLKMPCVVGKSMLMRRGDLEAIGGFKSVKDVLAEDYIIGRKMHKRGRKVILSNYIIRNVNEYWGLKKFLNRHTRWGKLRWKIGGIRYFAELINNAILMSLLPIFLWEPSKITISFALLTCLIKISGDLYLGKKTGAELNPFLYLLSPVKDLVIGLIWFVPILSNTVVWRGNRYIIRRDSMLSPYPETGLWSWRYRLVNAIKARLV
ncbi:MAG TPA: ceramide glucosyltransferase [Nitrospiraceae bacterium]|nr:ceramide glucosyltransferase [Nitrospiraceae bacterium]